MLVYFFKGLFVSGNPNNNDWVDCEKLMHNDKWRALNFLAQCLLMISKQQTLRPD